MQNNELLEIYSSIWNANDSRLLVCDISGEVRVSFYYEEDTKELLSSKTALIYGCIKSDYMGWWPRYFIGHTYVSKLDSIQLAEVMDCSLKLLERAED